MNLFRVTSTQLPELYVFAHGEPDAIEIYRSLIMLLDWNQGPSKSSTSIASLAGSKIGH